MTRERSEASKRHRPSLTCLDGGRPDADAPLRGVAGNASQHDDSEVETLTAAVWTLLDIVQDRMRALEHRSSALAGESHELRSSLQRVERQVRALRDPCPLSPRELEVIAVLAEGKACKQIAGELSLSASTVRTHVRNACGKLGAANRTQAVLVARSRGWL